MKNLFTVLVIAAIMFVPQSLNAQDYSSCDQWASTTDNGYTIYNNGWGSGFDTQCLWVYSYDNWGVWANHSDDGTGIKSYPNVDLQVDYDVADLPDITSTYAVTVPSSGSYNSAYDIWYDNYAYEIMLWMNWNGDVGPIAYDYSCTNGACSTVENLTVGGHTWDVYQGSNGSNIVYSFLRTSNSTSGTVDITAISEWLYNNGWFDNVNLHTIQFGFEITAASETDFIVSDYDVDIITSDDDDEGETFSGTYALIASHSEKALDTYEWGTTDGTNICQWTYWGGECQQFNIEPVDGIWHRITPAIATDQAFDVYGVSTENNANINTWTYWGGYGQQFKFESVGDGLYHIINRNSEKCLDIASKSTEDGANVIQYTCNSSSTNQMFELVSLKSTSESILLQTDLEVDVYPNPANDFINVSLADNLRKGVTVRVYNNIGQVVINDTYLSGDVSMLDISKLNSGLYTLQVYSGNTFISKTFTKN